MENNNIRVQLLTDELILTYTQNNVLTEYGDVDLKIQNRLKPIDKGVYDPNIFGSMFSDRCNCGTIRTHGVKCPRCGTMLLSEVNAFKRFARIELPVYYTSKYKFKKIIQLLRSNFTIKTDIRSEAFLQYNWRDPQCMDILQWNWDAENEALIMTDEITDFTKCSYEGLIKIISMYKPDLLKEFRSYINQYILVTPIILRAPQYTIEGNNRKLKNDYNSTVYQNIIYCVHTYYKETFHTLKTESGKAIFRGSLRCLIRTSMDNLSELMRSSHENLARNMQSNHLPNSGRAVIVPDPSLNIDEVEVPRHLMYETCRDEFIQFLSDKMNISIKEAEQVYTTQSELVEVQKLFDEYIEGDGKSTAKYVVINRQPSLYELGMCTCRVKLTNDYCMKIPQALCAGFNADFDGDQMAFYAVPKPMNDMMNETMSPRNVFLYKKNHAPLYMPTQEVMHGLIQASKVILVDKPETFDSIVDIVKYKKEHKDFKYQTHCILNGKETTLGRELLSEYFDKDINSYLGGFKNNIDAKNISWLYEQLRDKEDRVDRIRKIQEFALKITTLSGMTATRLSEMYLGIDQEFLDKMKEIENNPNLDRKAKEVSCRKIYEEFVKKELNMIPENIRVAINESSRAKVASLRDMAIPQFTVGPDGNFHITKTSLVDGLSQQDYIHHAIEKRSLQDIKQSAVPQSGYVTRQFTYLASEYIFADGEDKDNPGILVPKNKARGRTTVEGKIVESSGSDELVRVRSIITSTKKRGIITGDMVTNLFNYKVGSRIGMSMVSSFTEHLTQAGLKLKHGGNLYNLDPDNYTIALEDGVVEITDDWVILKGKSGKVYKYPKGSNYVANYYQDNKVKKGDRIGTNYHPVTPSYPLDTISKLCKASQSTSKKKFANNKKLVSECYALSDGEIHYKLVDNEIQVVIGDEVYQYNPDCNYYYPDGTKIKKYQRFCSGILDIDSYVVRVNDYIEMFYYFREQFYSALEVAHELVEFLYTLVVNKTEDDKLVVNSVTKTITGSDSFYKSLAFGYSNRSFEKIDYEGYEFVADPLTSVILSLITNNKLN